jgi:integrase
LAEISAKGLSATTVSDCRVFLATVLKSATRERPPRVTFNAAELVDHIKRDKTEKYALDEEEARRFLAAAKAHGRLYSALLVAVHLGPRAGELWGAKWSAVDWTKGTLHISSSLYWIGAHDGQTRTSATKSPKTAHGDRVIRLSKAALDSLKAHQAAEAKRLGKVPHRDAFIWTDGKGGPIDHRNMLRDVFYPVCAAAKIPYASKHECIDPAGHKGCPAFLTFHSLRHSAATLALAATKDVIAVSRMLGHASTEFTMDTYGHVLEKQQREIADYMDAAVQAR